MCKTIVKLEKLLTMKNKYTAAHNNNIGKGEVMELVYINLPLAL